MSWKDIPELVETFNTMEMNKVTPIVLEWKFNLPTRQDVQGMFGYTIKQETGLSGERETSAYIDENRHISFMPDKWRRGWCVIPKCDRNMDVLATLEITSSPFTVVEPQAVRDEVKKMAEDLAAKLDAQEHPITKRESTVTKAKEKTAVDDIAALTGKK